MIKSLTLLIISCLATPSFAQEAEANREPAQTRKVSKKVTTKTTTTRKATKAPTTAVRQQAPATETRTVRRTTTRPSDTSGNSGGGNVIAKIKSLATAGQYEEASKLLFGLSRNPKNASEAAQLKYMLGLMLMELKLNQVASFVFYDVIDEEVKQPGEGKYLRQSLGKLSYLSNVLDSDVLLKYAVSRIQVSDFPAESRDLFFYRLGELKYKEGNYEEAAKSFSKVEADSSVYPQALYKQGLAYAESGKLGQSIASYEELMNVTANKPVTDSNRVDAAMALARVYYQAKKWDKSIQYYRLIPRDTLQWHDTLFEESWAMMQSGRQFRSALSNFHTLHSPYYEDNYAPESLLLRAIVYLYICRYDEMEKVLDLFDRIYKPVLANVNKMLARSDNSRVYWDEIKKAVDYNRSNKEKKNFQRLNDMVIQALLTENQIKSNLNYYRMLEEEETRLSQLGPEWRQSAMGKFSKRIIDRRKASTEDLVGKLARNHLLKMKSEMRDFFEQGDFLKFEMVSGQKEVKGKEIIGKKQPHKQITDDNSRSFFISNGFEYWPFQGEYWLDELGNYHYVGVQACE
jgi:tetratricopeptide (TPR) repeat protein